MFRNWRLGFWRKRGIENVEDCYCACHSPFNKATYCTHCKGDTNAARAWRKEFGIDETARD